MVSEPIHADAAAPDFAVTHPLRPRVLASHLTWVMFLAATGFVYLFCRRFVPAGIIIPWVMAAGMFLGAWAAINLMLQRRAPDAEELVLTWGRAARFIIHGSNLVVLLAIWLFLPHTPHEQQVILGFCFAAGSPFQVIASPENVTANRIGIAAISGSLALWFAVVGGEAQLLFALFAAGQGIGLFILCDVIPRTVAEVVSGRLASDEAALRLTAANAAIARERDAKTQFIAAASHDLGQPLQAAALFFDQVMRAPEPGQREVAAAGVRRAHAAADQLLGHMLGHLRLEADAVEPQVSAMALTPVLQRMAAQFAPAAAAAGILIKVVKCRHRVVVDPSLFDRALGNLIGNAVQHSGGSRILLGARLRGGNVRIWVIDDGSGVGRGDVRHVFDDYYRGTGSGAGGFGLGLASVRRIAALLGGEAGLEPAWVRGAAFFLELPSGGGRYGLRRKKGADGADLLDRG